MYAKKTAILVSLSALMMIAGCNSDTDNNRVQEFVSLEQKANYENGSVTVDGVSIALAYTGQLLIQADPQQEYQAFALAAFGEDDQSPILVMSTENGFLPDFQEIAVNLPDAENGYYCDQISSEEVTSTVIKDAVVFSVVGQNCAGSGENAGLTKNVRMKITQSMLTAGTSRIEIVDDKAYLDTEFQLDEDLRLSGGLGTRAYNQVFDLVKNHPEVTIIVEGSISGSIHDDINMQTGRLIRKSGLSTHLLGTSDIASGAVDLFCSGNQRTMEDGAAFGVHSWSDGEGIEAGSLPVDSPLHNAQIAYFNEMLGEPVGKDFYFFTIHAAPADDIYYMSRSEIESFGILTD
ncbi:MAG: hypothetical protein KZQ88_04935 [Candidatus Thiodiazotropha sp. (ex Dulcina madagascariensis)]|nr:hypothetical protein [Candidatus Thiodiazotropha sp. (ex Dulcina madagascariensis)]MCU7927730.1 hypothetical protein [Candidatus Thiodiazotropha sp. (ex Dulcina madagascariensis)]